MRKEEEVVEVHPEGELQISGNPVPELGASVDTFAGKVNVRWVPEAAVSGLGLMVFFIEFLKLYQCERTREAGRTGNPAAVGAGRSLAVRPHQRDPGRRRESGAAGNDQGGERGLGAAGHEGHGRGGQRKVAEEASEGQL